MSIPAASLGGVHAVRVPAHGRVEAGCRAARRLAATRATTVGGCPRARIAGCLATWCHRRHRAGGGAWQWASPRRLLASRWGRAYGGRLPRSERRSAPLPRPNRFRLGGGISNWWGGACVQHILHGGILKFPAPRRNGEVSTWGLSDGRKWLEVIFTALPRLFVSYPGSFARSSGNFYIFVF